MHICSKDVLSVRKCAIEDHNLQIPLQNQLSEAHVLRVLNVLLVACAVMEHAAFSLLLLVLLFRKLVVCNKH